MEIWEDNCSSSKKQELTERCFQMLLLFCSPMFRITRSISKQTGKFTFFRSFTVLKYRITAIVIIKLLHLTYFFLPTTVSFMAVTYLTVIRGIKSVIFFIRLVKQCLILPFLLRICMNH